MKNRRIMLAACTWAVLSAAGGSASALDLITPTGVESSIDLEPAPVGPDLYPASNLIGDAGLPDGPGATAANYLNLLHDNFSGASAWVTQDPAPASGDWFAEGNPNPVLTFQLSAPFWISHLAVWGYANATQNNNEAKTLQVELSADGGATWSPSEEVVRQRSGRNQQTVALTSPGPADWVRITVTDNFSGEAGAAGGDRVGLGEVKFLGDPVADPLLSTVALVTRPLGLVEEFQIPVKNNGSSQTLTISSVAFTGPDAAKFSLAGTPPVLPPGASGIVRVAFNGTGGFESVSTTVELSSNDSAVPLKSVLITGPRRADTRLITPSAVTSLTETVAAPVGPDLYKAINLINNSSLANGAALTAENYQAVTHPTTSAATAWVTTAPNGGLGDWFTNGQPEPVLTFSLDQSYILTGMAIWGYGAPNNNEARTVRVALSTDGGTTWGPEETVIRQRTGPAQHTVELASPGRANAVRFTLADNFYALPGVAGGGDRVGLGEVKFLGQPVRDPYIQSPVQITRPFAALEEFDVPVRNLGATQSVSIGTPSFAGDSAPKFTVVSSPSSLAPGASGIVRIRFDYGGDPAAVTASLLIPNGDTQVALQVVKLSGPVQNPKILVEPAALDFGSPAGGTGFQTITLRNTGTDLAYASAEIWGAAATLYELDMDLTNAIDPGATVTGTLTFTGNGAQGLLPATLVFRTPDPVQPVLKVPVSALLPVTSKLVAYWPFNEADGAQQAADALGTHTGWAENVTFGAEGPPVAYAGSGARFDGIASRIRVDHAPELNPSSFTMTLWAKLDAAPATGAFHSALTIRDDANSVGGGNNGAILYANGANWQFWTGDSVGGWANSASAFTVGAWQHLALVYDHETKVKRLYVNGLQTAAIVTAYSPNGPQRDPLWIGSGADDGGSFWWAGGIDEVAVFRAALTAQEVTTVMNDGLTSFLPQPPAAGFDVTSFTLNPVTGAAVLAWGSEAGASYRVESSTSLTGVWNPVASPVPSGGTSTSWTGTVTVPAGGRLFLRVVRL